MVFWIMTTYSLVRLPTIYPEIGNNILVSAYQTTWCPNSSKVKSVPLQAWSGPEGSRKLRFADFMTTAQEGGKVVSLTHRPHLPPGNSPGTHFC